MSVDVASVDGARGELLSELLRGRLVKSVPVATPAAGAEWSVTVPAGVVWIVQSIFARFLSSVVVANRFPRLGFTDGSVTIGRVVALVTIPANQAWDHSYLRGAGAAWSGTSGVGLTYPLPDFRLPAGYTIFTTTPNLDAGDQWSQIVVNVIEVAQWQVQQQADWIGERLR